jgi:hypothetical protein
MASILPFIRVRPDFDDASHASGGATHRKRRRHQDRLIDRTAHRRMRLASFKAGPTTARAADVAQNASPICKPRHIAAEVT